MCRARRQPHRGDTALVCEEIGDFVQEIIVRVNTIATRGPSLLTIRQIKETLHPAIQELITLDLNLRKRLPSRRGKEGSQTTPEPAPQSQAPGSV